MKKTAIITLALASASIVATGIAFSDEGPAAFFRRDQTGNWTGSLYANHPQRPAKVAVRAGRSNDLPRILAITRSMGIPDRLAARVCRVESSCRINGPAGPKTKHGRHYGAYQTRPAVAARFGYNPRIHGPLRGEVALKFGALHLADCYRRANRNEALAARCHVGGPGAIAKRLAPWAERYAQSYTRQVQAAWAGNLRPAPRQRVAWAGELR
jgi:hypothetical protein